MVVVATDVIIDAFAGDVVCCGRDGWWWSLSMRMAVTWGFADVVDGDGGRGRGHQHVCG